MNKKTNTDNILPLSILTYSILGIFAIIAAFMVLEIQDMNTDIEELKKTILVHEEKSKI
jgi:hypothetical protein